LNKILKLRGFLRIGFHYNGFLNVLDNSNLAYNAKSSIKIFKKIYFCSNCGTWVKNNRWVELRDVNNKA